MSKSQSPEQATPVLAEGSAPTEASAPADGQVRGRSIFMVETVAAGVAVRPAFLAEDGRLLDLPAVFPDVTYAMAQIDELKQLVAAHFAQAAQVGAQVIAAQAAANLANGAGAASGAAAGDKTPAAVASAG